MDPTKKGSSLQVIKSKYAFSLLHEFAFCIVRFFILTQEGDAVNVDVTAPGATLALGLMFFNTGNT
jgi:hypothetical protein